VGPEWFHNLQQSEIGARKLLRFRLWAAQSERLRATLAALPKLAKAAQAAGLICHL
jgi:hypothetical protein